MDIGKVQPRQQQNVSNFSTNHPIINNAQQYMYEQKFVTIDSSDVDRNKYPCLGQFDIELPQEYSNVQAIKLSSWSFPSNYNVFSALKNNITMSFSIIAANNGKTPYSITIEEGTYTNQQMATELTNKMNSAVSGTYSGFTVVYNEIDSKLYFGNNTDDFQIEGLADPTATKNVFPSYSNSGLLSYLGFNGRSVKSVSSKNAPRFFYSNINGGNWLPTPAPAPIPDPAPVPPTIVVPPTYYTLTPPNKTNLSGNPYFFIELNGFNCIDEMIPYTNSEYTRENNVTNGTLNAAFAKLPKNIPNASLWTNNNTNVQLPIRVFNPPAEKIRKLRVKFREHTGEIVRFSEFSFMLEFVLFKPQIERQYSMFVPEATQFSYN